MNKDNKYPLYKLVQLGVSRQEIADYLGCDRYQVDRYFSCNSRNLSSSRYLLLMQLLQSKFCSLSNSLR